MNRFFRALSVAIFVATPAFARDEMPWPNTGNCPHGYVTSGGHCMPSQGAQPAIPKSRGNCPWGWTSSGDFCLKSGG
jgi:hypothetical protein